MDAAELFAKCQKPTLRHSFDHLVAAVRARCYCAHNLSSAANAATMSAPSSDSGSMS